MDNVNLWQTLSHVTLTEFDQVLVTLIVNVVLNVPTLILGLE